MADFQMNGDSRGMRGAARGALAEALGLAIDVVSRAAGPKVLDVGGRNLVAFGSSLEEVKPRVQVPRASCGDLATFAAIIREHMDPADCWVAVGRLGVECAPVSAVEGMAGSKVFIPFYDDRMPAIHSERSVDSLLFWLRGLAADLPNCPEVREAEVEQLSAIIGALENIRLVQDGEVRVERKGAILEVGQKEGRRVVAGGRIAPVIQVRHRWGCRDHFERLSYSLDIRPHKSAGIEVSVRWLQDGALDRWTERTLERLRELLGSDWIIGTAP